jgi:hypothetical protein
MPEQQASPCPNDAAPSSTRSGLLPTLANAFSLPFGLFRHPFDRLDPHFRIDRRSAVS